MPGRRLNQIIRISTANEDAVSLKQAGETLAALEEDDAGAWKGWSVAELTITGCDKAELAVVVGVLLPQAALDAVPDKPLTPNSSKDFDQATHAWIPTNDKTYIVIRKLSSKRCNLFVLASRNPDTGLCAVKPLPRSQTGAPRLFFFQEWTETLKAIGRTQVRYDAWRANISRFVERYVAEDEDDLSDEVAQSVASETDPAVSESPATMSMAEQRDDNEGVVENLLRGQDPFGLHDAEEAAEACQVRLL
jgi:hypothetical protein